MCPDFAGLDDNHMDVVQDLSSTKSDGEDRHLCGDVEVQLTWMETFASVVPPFPPLLCLLFDVVLTVLR